MKFRVLSFSYRDIHGVDHARGSIVESATDLSARFANAFELLNPMAPGIAPKPKAPPPLDLSGLRPFVAPWASKTLRKSARLLHAISGERVDTAKMDPPSAAALADWAWETPLPDSPIWTGSKVAVVVGTPSPEACALIRSKADRVIAVDRAAEGEGLLPDIILCTDIPTLIAGQEMLRSVQLERGALFSTCRALLGRTGIYVIDVEDAIPALAGGDLALALDAESVEVLVIDASTEATEAVLEASQLSLVGGRARTHIFQSFAASDLSAALTDALA